MQYLPECVAHSQEDCYTDDYFTFDGEKVEIVAPGDSSVAAVWVRDTSGDGYASGAWYGVTFQDDEVVLATTGGDVALGVAGLFVAALLITAGFALFQQRKDMK